MPTSFTAEIKNGYVFKILIDYLKTMYRECSFIFDSGGVNINQIKNDTEVATHVQISKHDLGKYIFDSTEDKYEVTLNMLEMFNILEKLEKFLQHDSISIIKKRDNDEYLSINISNEWEVISVNIKCHSVISKAIKPPRVS